VDSPRNPKPKTPQKSSGALVSVKASSSMAATAAAASSVLCHGPAQPLQRNHDIDDILDVSTFPASSCFHPTITSTAHNIFSIISDNLFYPTTVVSVFFQGIGSILGVATPSSSTPCLAHGNGSDQAAAGTTARCARPSVGLIHGPSDTRACSKLRCTKCDFAVARFDGFEWKANVDYLFFRNNHPETAKLKTCLKLHHGSVAYCCQCSWTTAAINSVTPVGRDVRWVCSQH
jgi:hypothetical protein